VFNADPDFIKTFNIKMIEGNFFKIRKSNLHQVVINEEFAKKMKFKNPVGKYIREKGINDNIPSKIVGIIKNYHIAPFDREIHPLIIFPNFKWGNNWMNYRYMFIKIRPGNIPGTLSYIEKTVKKHNPHYPFNCQFYDTYFERLYHTEQMTDNIVRGFAILAILISFLGLFGLTSFTTEQRRKEIGIRKTLGASIKSVMYLLSKEFIKWIIISNVIAVPIAYYFVNKWLQHFSYHINIDGWTFLLAGVLSLVIAFLTVSYQVIRAATANPVEALRYE
jgi:putative ABC transport system permease protein